MEGNVRRPNAYMRVSRDDLEELQGLSRHLSDFITVLMYHASLLPPSLPAPAFERMIIMKGLISETETYMKKMMWCLGHLDFAKRIKLALAEESEGTDSEGHRTSDSSAD